MVNNDGAMIGKNKAGSASDIIISWIGIDTKQRFCKQKLNTCRDRGPT